MRPCLRAALSALQHTLIWARTPGRQSVCSGRGDVNKLKVLRVKAVIEVSGEDLSCLAILIAARAGLTPVGSRDSHPIGQVWCLYSTMPRMR